MYHKIRHLPVMEDGALLGIVSIGDVVSSYIRQQRETIEDLTSYLYK